MDMTLRDRGTKKWTAMMLPEHVRELKKSLIDEKRIKRPILDEQQIEQLEETIIEAIEKDIPLLFSTFHDGFIKTIKGEITFIDHIHKQFRVKETSEMLHYIAFEDVINIEKCETHD